VTDDERRDHEQPDGEGPETQHPEAEPSEAEHPEAPHPDVENPDTDEVPAATTADAAAHDVAATDGNPHAGRAHGRRSRVLIAVLCALLGFALVAQVRLTQGAALGSLRQDDLVRLLDEVTQRGDELTAERDRLRADRAELLSGEDSRRVALEAARERAVVTGVLAGTLPVEGQGITMTVSDPGADVPALTLFHVLEELRNAGAEAVEVSGQRLTASSWFADARGGVVVDDVLITPPYEWKAIGNAQTLAVALDIPGGALSAIRNAGGRAVVEQEPLIEITAVRAVEDPEFATPVPAASPTS
jgi:uncharacterized protein YlxW (UPF0749 family)